MNTMRFRLMAIVAGVLALLSLAAGTESFSQEAGRLSSKELAQLIKDSDAYFAMEAKGMSSENSQTSLLQQKSKVDGIITVFYRERPSVAKAEFYRRRGWLESRIAAKGSDLADMAFAMAEDILIDVRTAHGVDADKFARLMSAINEQRAENRVRLGDELSARQFYSAAVTFAQECSLAGTPEEGSIQAGLAGRYFRGWQWQEARIYAERALAMLTRPGSQRRDDQAVLDCYWIMAVAKARLLQAAENDFIRFLTASGEKITPSKEADTYREMALNVIATAPRADGLAEVRKEALKRAYRHIQRAKQLISTPPKAGLLVADASLKLAVYRDLASIAADNGSLADAEQAYKDALAIAPRQFPASGGPEVQTVLSIREHYAKILSDSGRANEAAQQQAEIRALSPSLNK